jgi:hypothetical protein
MFLWSSVEHPVVTVVLQAGKLAMSAGTGLQAVGLSLLF